MSEIACHLREEPGDVAGLWMDDVASVVRVRQGRTRTSLDSSVRDSRDE
jgi:hypothetical protein